MCHYSLHISGNSVSHLALVGFASQQIKKHTNSFPVFSPLPRTLTEAEKTPLSSQGLQDESQVTTSEPPDSELAAALTAEATALFTRSLFQEAEEKFLSALEADPGHIPALTGFSNLLTFAPEQWQESLEYAELAHSLAPKDATALFPPGLGFALRLSF